MAKTPKAPKESPRAEPRSLSIVIGGGVRQPVTTAEFARHVDSIVDLVNRHILRIGLEHTAVADELFRHTCNNEVAAAFDLRANPPPLYVALRRRVGRSLELPDAAALSTYVQVGALQHHVREPGFRRAEWADKVRMLALVDDPAELGLLRRALKHLAQRTAGEASLAEWIAANTPPKTEGRPRGLTMQGARQLAKKGHALDTKSGRAQLVKQLKSATPEARKALLADLRNVMKNLQTVIAETEDDGDDDE